MNYKCRYAIGDDMSPFDKKLAAAAKAASEDAVRRLKAQGLPVYFIRGNDIIEQDPDGAERVIGKVQPE